MALRALEDIVELDLLWRQTELSVNRQPGYAVRGMPERAQLLYAGFALRSKRRFAVETFGRFSGPRPAG